MISFNDIHKQWDNRVGKDLVNEFEKFESLYCSLDVVNENILETLYRIKLLGKEEVEFYDVAFWYNYLMGPGVFVDGLSQLDKTNIKKLSEYIDKWMQET